MQLPNLDDALQAPLLSPPSFCDRLQTPRGLSRIDAGIPLWPTFAMTIDIPLPTEKAPASQRSLLQSMRRGLAQKCPACGIGAMYVGYLKVTDRCSACGQG